MLRKIIFFIIFLLGIALIIMAWHPWQKPSTATIPSISNKSGLDINLDIDTSHKNPDNIPSEPAEEGPEQIDGIVQDKYRVVISSIGVDMAIVLGDDEKNALLNGAWHIPGSGTPDNPDGYKNIVLSGHRYLYTFGPNTFFNLDKVQVGDIIQIFWQDQEYKYQVNNTKIVEPNEISILEDTGQEKLTLFTCHPVYTTDQRLVIEALPIQ